MSGALEIKDLSVELGENRVLDRVGLGLETGSYGVVVGPSGAGKSTLLRAVAGLVACTGSIRIGDQAVCAGQQVASPEDRPVGFLFQGLALWPHMTVQQHLRYALKGRGVPASEHAGRIGEVLSTLGIEQLRDRHPGALSGGERQRLALARALVARPTLLLLDEPTSSVDPEVARDVRELLLDLNRRLGTTVVHVTHDQAEALELGDRIVLLEDGRVLQEGGPREVYERPTSRRAAAFIGEGGLLPGTLREDGRADTPLGVVPCDAEGLRGAVWMLARPRNLCVVAEGEGVPVDVQRITYRGGRFAVRVHVAGYHLMLDLDECPAEERLRIRVERPLWAIEERTES